MDFNTLIQPPKTFSDAQDYLLDMLSYDMQEWIQSQPRHVAAQLYHSELGTRVYRALDFPDNNPELLKDCESSDPGKVIELVLFAVWIRLNTHPPVRNSSL